jgi:adenosylmethionine-8-amino-7-oxononanoate aminotransferase
VSNKLSSGCADHVDSGKRGTYFHNMFHNMDIVVKRIPYPLWHIFWIVLDMDTNETDRKHMGRSEAPEKIEITGSEGSYVVDASGRKYIDFTAGSCVGNLGWTNPVIEQAILGYKGPAYVPPGFLYRPWAMLADLLAELSPGDLSVCYRTTGGSEAVDAAMQMAMLYTGRNKFMSIEGAYHGNTIGTLSIGDRQSREAFPGLLKGCYTLKQPLNERALERVEARLRKEDIAAFIMEPVGVNIGVLVPDTGFMEGLRELCTRYGTLLILDEVATGFGRTGKLFASEHSGIEPDIMCIAKAVTGGFAGLGVTITTRRIATKIGENINLYSTYGWHPLGVNVALASVTYWNEHKEQLLDHVAALSDLFGTRLREMPFDEKPLISRKGLAIAVIFKDTRYVERIREKCLAAGLIVLAEDGRMMLTPPLTTTRELAEEGLDILEECIAASRIHPHQFV